MWEVVRLKEKTKKESEGKKQKEFCLYFSHQVFAWCTSRAGADCSRPVRKSPSV